MKAQPCLPQCGVGGDHGTGLGGSGSDPGCVALGTWHLCSLLSGMGWDDCLLQRSCGEDGGGRKGCTVLPLGKQELRHVGTHSQEKVDLLGSLGFGASFPESYELSFFPCLFVISATP